MLMKNKFTCFNFRATIPQHYVKGIQDCTDIKKSVGMYLFMEY